MKTYAYKVMFDRYKVFQSKSTCTLYMTNHYIQTHIKYKEIVFFKQLKG